MSKRKTKDESVRDDLKAALFKNKPVLLLGPSGCGKSTLLYEVVAEQGYKIQAYDLRRYTTDQLKELLSKVRLTSFMGERVIWHFPCIDKVNKKFLAAFVKTAQAFDTRLVVLESTHKKAELKSITPYCKVIEVPMPHYTKRKALAKKLGHTFDTSPKNFHEAVTGNKDTIEDSDFTKITKYFSLQEVDVDPRFMFWINHNARRMCAPFDAAMLYHYGSSIARNGQHNLMNNLRITGGGRPEFPYFLRKRSLKRRENE